MKTMPGRIVTADQLREAQLWMAHQAAAPQHSHDLLLAAATGRVLARPLHLPDTDGKARQLDPGTRLDWYLLPLLAAGGHISVPVFAPVRCAIVAVQADSDGDAQARDASVVAVMLQAAMTELGVRSVSSNLNLPPSASAASLSRFARHCDLLLVIDDSATRRPAAAGLAPPPIYEIDGCPCLVLPRSALAALSQFVVFGVPLIRRLQGRSLDLPPLRTATEAGTDLRLRCSSALVCVSAHGDGDAIQVRPCAPCDALPGPDFAPVSGVAWRPEGQRLLTYLPLAEWLH